MVSFGVEAIFASLSSSLSLVLFFFGSFGGFVRMLLFDKSALWSNCLVHVVVSVYQTANHSHTHHQNKNPIRDVSVQTFIWIPVDRTPFLRSLGRYLNVYLYMQRVVDGDISREV